MAETTRHAFAPDWAVPPGETLLETIDALGITQADLASRTGHTPKMINEIVRGKAPIRPTTALEFERVLGIPARFWLNLEANYSTSLAEIDERAYLTTATSWVKEFPWSALVKAGAVVDVRDPIARARALLGFFRVANLETWNARWASPDVAYRRSPAFQSRPFAMSAWLQLGERAAERITCEPYDATRFRSSLAEIRTLTTSDPEVCRRRLTDLCARAGVALVFVPELPKTHVSGATRWITPDKALIQLSLRHKSDDHLWFCFFHECAHILLHGKKDVFLDDGPDDAEKEAEANTFAADFLIPTNRYAAFLNQGDLSVAAIERFAAEIGIAPGIVVGRLQHDRKVPFTLGNELKRRRDWPAVA
jgi:addiction module HigA family antidote